MKKVLLPVLFAVFMVSGIFATPAHAQIGPVVLTHTLSLGSRGSDVSLLQSFLKDRGFFTYATTTGYFGALTKTAVTAFQTAFTINPVGIAGPITRQKILELSSQSGGVSTKYSVPAKIYSGGTSHRSRPDVTAPSVPADLAESSVTQTTLTVSWTASTDSGSGLSGYHIERCEGDACTSFVEIATPTTSTYDDTGLTANTIYRYRVSAADVAGNVSSYSSILDVTTSPIPTYALTVSKAGTGTGTVSSSPAGINCGSTCSHTYTEDTSVTLTASAAVGSTFSGWSGACSGTGSCVVTMSAVRSVTATFALNTYALTVMGVGGGAGTVTSTPSGISCGATCSALFGHGTVVTLTAVADGASSFAGWSGGCSGFGVCMVTVSAPSTVIATFDPL